MFSNAAQDVSRGDTIARVDTTVRAPLECLSGKRLD